MRLEVIAFTAKGAALGEKLLDLYPDGALTAPVKFGGERARPLAQSLSGWARDRFQQGNTLVFIGSAGIAVRAIAPFVGSKATDPAVLCVDEGGGYVIPLLSGHIGGANRAAGALAGALGATAVITTATDLRGLFAPDAWAAQNDCAIQNPAAIKAVSAALLAGEPVGLRCEFPITGKLPAGLSLGGEAQVGVEIALWGTSPFPCTLSLIPRVLIAGIGCRKGVPAARIESALLAGLSRLDLPIQAVGRVATIHRKAGEPGLLALCDKLGVRLVSFGPGELMAVQGDFTPSDRVLRITGADNVCERAVACAGGEPLLPKTVLEGVTVALGVMERQISFEEEWD